MNNNVEKEVLTLLCIKTNKGCFISDCKVTSGYDFNYEKNRITKMLFDGKEATTSYCQNWYFIDEYPTLIQEKKPGQTINKRYILRDESLESDKMPKAPEDFVTIDEITEDDIEQWMKNVYGE